jgi:hypothetical protein
MWNEYQLLYCYSYGLRTVFALQLQNYGLNGKKKYTVEMIGLKSTEDVNSF